MNKPPRRQLNALSTRFLILSLMFQKKNNWHFGGGIAEAIREFDQRAKEVYSDSQKGFGWDYYKIMQLLENSGSVEKKKINGCNYFRLTK